MKLSAVIRASLILATTLSGKCCTGNVISNDSSGFGYQLLLAKMDYLEYKFQELQVEIKEQVEAILLNQESSKRAILEQTSDILEQQKIFANHEMIMKSIYELRPRKHPSDNSKLIESLRQPNAKRAQKGLASISSCILKNSGRYLLELDDSTSFEVYCEQHNKSGGGWLMFQYRFDGSVDFYRTWEDYKQGFGDLDGEFWLGLEKLHKLTSRQDVKLLVLLEDFSGTEKYALYDKFAIGDEDEQYKLKTLAGYEGTAGDSLNHNKDERFSTQDRDNDKALHNCAENQHAAWWYYNCGESNLNGMHHNSRGDDKMSWLGFSSAWKGLKVSRMMIKY